MLKKNYEFKQVLTKGKSYYGIYIYGYLLENHKKENLLGLAISTKLGKAYQRNRLKRLLRESFRKIEIDLKKGYSIVFLIKKDVDVKNINYKDIYDDMFSIFKKANLIK